MNYDNPNLTVREQVESSLALVQARLTHLRPTIDEMEADVAIALDRSTRQALSMASNAIRGTVINLEAEARRLQAIIADWNAVDGE